ncbi:ABC transporter ATP-binding protein [Stieleria varia]|uniref:ABC transporter ATP-binding protein n=1 Tax=Stieleria varia TaxID=2528005 RepID=UPI001E289868|nr:ABC transporter ATP-binding protein [Stieleria varia]
MASSNATLQIRDLAKVYQTAAGTVNALRGINLDFQRGEMVAIVGPSGSGKSTLLNLIGVLDRPSSGEVSIEGIPVSSLNDSEQALVRNQLIGFVFQSYNLIHRSTVINNVALPGMISHRNRRQLLDRARKLLSIMGIADKSHCRPSQLSGGQQQRVAIARSLINDPPIILADEPTGNLDSSTGQEVFDLLCTLTRQLNRTVIMVTHNLELSQLVDRAVYLRDGMVEREIRN